MKSKTDILFKNIIKQSIKNKSQTIIMVFLFLITSLFFMLTIVSNEQINDARISTEVKSNKHDFLINLFQTNYSGVNKNSIINDELNQYAVESAANLQDNNFIWDRVETRNYYQNAQQDIIKLVTDNLKARVDKVVITKGYNISQNSKENIDPLHQAVMSPIFAKKHHIKIGNFIRIEPDKYGSSLIIKSKNILPKPQQIPTGMNWFKIVGFGVSSDFETPLLNQQIKLPNKSHQGILYVNPAQFGLSRIDTSINDGNSYWKYDRANDNWPMNSAYDKEIYYVSKFRKNTNRNIDEVSNYLKDNWNSQRTPDSKVDLNNLCDSKIKDELSNININLASNLNRNNNQELIKSQLLNKINTILKKHNKFFSPLWSINLFNDKNMQSTYDYSNFNNISQNIKPYVLISQNQFATPTNAIKNFKHFGFQMFNTIKFSTNTDFSNNNSQDNTDILNFVLNNPDNLSEFNLMDVYTREGNSNIYYYIKNNFINNIIQIASKKYSDFKGVKEDLENNLNFQFATASEKTKFSDINLTNKQTEKDIINFKINYDDSSYNVNLPITIIPNNFHSFSNPSKYSDPLAYKVGDTRYLYSGRTSELPKEVIFFNSYMLSVLVIILVISAISLFLVIRKQIFYMRKQLGTLKALGYDNATLVASFLAIPVLFAAISVIFMYPVSIFCQYMIINFSSHYSDLAYNKINWVYNIKSFFLTLILLLSFLVVISLLSANKFTKKTVLNLIDNREENPKNATNMRFFIWMKKPYQKLKFKTRFQISIFFQSLSKVSWVVFTVIIGTFLLSLSILIPQVMEDNITYSLIGKDYNYSVEYQHPLYNEPTTFYKTYNEDANDSTKIPLTGTDYSKIYLNQDNMGPNIYDYNPNLNIQTLGMELSNLNYSNFSNTFLDIFDKKANDPIKGDLLARKIWNDYPQISDTFKEGTKISNIYNSYRNFYLSYKNSVNLIINPYFLTSDSINPNNLNINLSKFNSSLPNSKKNSDFDLDALNFQHTKSNFTIKNDSDFILFNYNQMQITSSKQQEITQYIKQFNTWFYLTFYGRLSQSIVQEIFSQSPSFIRQIFKSKIEKNEEYNLAFNLNPYSPKTDELNTMISASANNLDFNIYGLSDADKFVHLETANHQDLNRLIKNNVIKSNDNNSKIYKVIINQSLSRKLHWNLNNEYQLSSYNQVLEDSNNKPLLLKNYNYNNIYVSNDSRMNNYSGIRYINNKIYDPSLSGIDADWMTQQTQQGNLKLSQDTQNINVQIVGISSNYGLPEMYMSNENAIHILKYDKTRDFMFNQFKKEWWNSSNMIAKGIRSKGLDSYYDLVQKSKQPIISQNGLNYKDILTIFNNEHPFYNQKLSKANTNYDINYGLSTWDPYGDFSKISLNGGNALKVGDNSGIDYNWVSSGMGSVKAAIPQSLVKTMMSDYNSVINYVLITFAIISIGICFIIINLISTIIFSENRRIILTMKVLGYKDRYIAESLFGFYWIIILLVFLMIYPLAWFITHFAVTWISNNSTSGIVIPYFWNWFVPFIILGILSIIFIFIFWINYHRMQKTNVVTALASMSV